MALSSLDSELLNNLGCAFGGGTAIALLKDEFRESVDIDFLVSNLKNFGALRKLFREQSLPAILSPNQMAISEYSPFTNDQYAIRGRIRVGAETIKFEIVHEGRFELEQPTSYASLGNTPVLTRRDQVICKLLANSDRYLDDYTFNRDILDLAFLEIKPKEFALAMGIAIESVGPSVLEDYKGALDLMLTKPGWLDRCISALNFAPNKAQTLQKLNHLKNLQANL